MYVHVGIAVEYLFHLECSGHAGTVHFDNRHLASAVAVGADEVNERICGFCVAIAACPRGVAHGVVEYHCPVAAGVLHHEESLMWVQQLVAVSFGAL